MKNIRCILYARKSTDEEDRQVRSIEAQLHELKEFAIKEKLEIVKDSTVLVGILGVSHAAAGGEMRLNYFKNTAPRR